MPITVNLRKMLHRKSQETCAVLPAGNTLAGGFVVSDKRDKLPGHNTTYYIGGTSAIYNYEADEDAWISIVASGITGTFGAGACGEFKAISAPGGAQTLSASAGSTTTTLITALTLTRSLKGCKVRVVAGQGAGYEGVILHNTVGNLAVITLATASSVTFNATTQFQLFAGSVWFFCPGAGTVGFSVYDRATNTWTSRSVTGLPTTWASDGQLVSTPGGSRMALPLAYGSVTGFVEGTGVVSMTGSFTVDLFKGAELVIDKGKGAGKFYPILSNTANTITILLDTSSADYYFTKDLPDSTSSYSVWGFGFSVHAPTSFSATTIADNTKTWPASGFINSQVRIISGTGAGQIRTITANTATVLTVAAWTVTPDATSNFVIEGNDDYLYLLGNAAVTLYRYSISGNTWSTLTPVSARSSAPGAGMTADWIDVVPDTTWAWNGLGAAFLPLNSIMTRQAGRYIYSAQGGNSSNIHSYDIAGNTWAFVPNYGNLNVGFNTGSCSVFYDGMLYLMEGATGRIHKFDVANNCIGPLLAKLIPEGAAVAGDKMFISTIDEGAAHITYLYSLGHTRAELTRWLLV